MLNEDTIAAADVTLVEGSRGKPDDLTVDLVFDRLDLNVLLAVKKKGPLPAQTCRSSSIVRRIRWSRPRLRRTNSSTPGSKVQT